MPSGAGEMMTPQATVLIVEDDAGMRQFLEDVLRLHGYQVLTATDVPEAEATGQRLGLEHLDLVILDLQVHEGDTLGQRWGAQAPHLPFILISDDRMSGRLDPPVVWWLAKPLTPDTLLMAVRDSLGS
jgi:two-component system response regulator FlrC